MRIEMHARAMKADVSQSYTKVVSGQECKPIGPSYTERVPQGKLEDI